MIFFWPKRGPAYIIRHDYSLYDGSIASHLLSKAGHSFGPGEKASYAFTVFSMKFSTEMQAATGASHIKSFKNILKDFKFEKDLGDEKNNQKLLYEPKGVCALITPWNWPINQVNLKVIPALASYYR